MPDYSSLLGTLGYDASSLQGLFGQYFKDVDPRWSQFLEPSFETAQTALGELPGMRRGLLGQLTSGLQERGVAAGRGLQARRAGAGFAGFGALDVLGRTTRAGFEREADIRRYRIGEDIARKRAGVLGTLGGKVGGFLEQLLAAGTEGLGDGGGAGTETSEDVSTNYGAWLTSMGYTTSEERFQEWKTLYGGVAAETKMGFTEWLASVGMTAGSEEWHRTGGAIWQERYQRYLGGG